MNFLTELLMWGQSGEHSVMKKTQRIHLVWGLQRYVGNDIKDPSRVGSSEVCRQ